MPIPGLPFKLGAEDMGVPNAGAAIQQGLNNYLSAQKARFAPKTEETNLKYLLAQMAESQQRLPLLAAQTQETQARVPLYESEAQLKGVEAQKAKFIMGLLQSYLGGEQGSQGIQGAQNEQSYIPSIAGNSLQLPLSPRQQTSLQNKFPQNTALSGNQQAKLADNQIGSSGTSGRGFESIDDLPPVVATLLGLPGNKQEVKYDPGSGQAYTTNQYPSGKTTIDVKQVGRLPEEVERSKKFAEADTKAYDAISTEAREAASKVDSADQLVKLISEHPEYKNVVGPLNYRTIKLGQGTREEKILAGQIKTLTGDITLNAASSLKGAFTGRDQQLINSLKPNDSDNADIFIGKARMLKNAFDTAQKRLVYSAQLIREQGYPSDKAFNAAVEKYPLQLPKQMDFKSKKDAINHLANLSIEELQALKGVK